MTYHHDPLPRISQLLAGHQDPTTIELVQQIQLYHNLHLWDAGLNEWYPEMRVQVTSKWIRMHNIHLAALAREIAISVMCMAEVDDHYDVYVIGRVTDIEVMHTMFNAIAGNLTSRFDTVMLIERSKKILERFTGIGDGNFAPWELRKITDAWFDHELGEISKVLTRGRTNSMLRSMIVMNEYEIKERMEIGMYRGVVNA